MKITLKMAPKRKQVVHLKKIAQERKASASQPLPDTTNRVDPDMMVISGLLSGNGYEATKRQALRFNQMTPCKKTFYNHQSKIIKQVNEMVSEDCRNYAKKIKKNATLSCDCCWNHKVCGSSGTVTVYDHQQKKVVGCETLMKPKGKFNGNYIGNSNNMETEGLERIFNQIENSISNKNVTLAHDHDNKTHQFLLRHKSMNVGESLDPGHATQELKRKANTFFESCAREIKDKNNEERKTIKLCFAMFVTLISKLVIWFRTLISCVHSDEKKEQLWLNTKQHVLGDHKNCCHPKDITDKRTPGRPKKRKADNESYWTWDEGIRDSKLAEKLDTFLSNTCDLVKQTGKAHTQNNESINANIRRLAPKHKVFSNSNEARAAIAIGIKNDHHFESRLIEKVCPKSISQNVLNEIKKDETSRHERNCLKKTPNEKKEKLL